jgi:hypothetical protein
VSSPAASRNSVWRNHGLSIVLLLLFAGTFVGQIWAGWLSHNEELRDHGEPAISLGRYLVTGHFGEATFENWESEFLQMSAYVMLTAFLFQRGSAESKDPDEAERERDDPRSAAELAAAPWPVRHGGWVRRLYGQSLSIAFALLFLASFVLHAVAGLPEFNAERLAHGSPASPLATYVGSSRFWFESFQNWQSEFLSLAAMVVLSIFLRQRGSPESKPVAAPTWETGH